jgi:uncharacterized OB-fold protein
VEPPRARFEAACERGVLEFQWDVAAERAVFPPRLLPGLEWRESAGIGTVYACTVVHPRDGEPRGIVLVDLDEGFRMMSTVVGAEASIGMRVHVEFSQGVPEFRPL